jgi:hypothetical protein
VQEFLRGDDGPSASHSSRTGGSSDASNLKSIYQTNDAGTSSSLKLITQLIVVVFLLLLVVSTINLVLSLDRNTKLQSEVSTVKLSYDRLARHVQMRQLLRGMVAMANDYQEMDSRINKDSFSAYIEKYREHIGEMKRIHDQIDKDQFEYSEKFKEMLTEKRVALEYLDQHN